MTDDEVAGFLRRHRPRAAARPVEAAGEYGG
jgi:hypothetical protein